MEKRKKFNKNIIFILLGLAIISYSFFVILSLPLETKTIDTKFSVSSKYGVNLNSSELDFGRIVPGSSITRNIELSNNHNFKVNIQVFASKNIVNFIYSKDNISAEAGQTVSIPITLAIPSNESYGNYSGKIRFEIRKD
jgi:hypothetical protein